MKIVKTRLTNIFNGFIRQHLEFVITIQLLETGLGLDTCLGWQNHESTKKQFALYLHMIVF